MSSNLQPNQFECCLFVYGNMEDGIILARGTAGRMASLLVGTTTNMLEGSIGRPARILSVRMEDDSPSDPTKGRVIAICEPVTLSAVPYRPQNMETK